MSIQQFHRRLTQDHETARLFLALRKLRDLEQNLVGGEVFANNAAWWPGGGGVSLLRFGTPATLNR